MDPRAADDLQSRGYCLLTLSPQDAAAIQAALVGTRRYFTESTPEAKLANRVSSKLGFKLHRQKERFQLRRAGSTPDPRLEAAAIVHPPACWGELWEAYAVLDRIAMECLHTLLQRANVDIAALEKEHCDPLPLLPGTLSTSVFNCYHYFNRPDLDQRLRR